MISVSVKISVNSSNAENVIALAQIPVTNKQPIEDNGILLQPGPRDNGNYPPEGCIVLSEGRRRPKVEAAQRLAAL